MAWAPAITGTFLDAVYYNWLIGGTDAHAKNYALLIASAGQVRLAPLYDIASILPYPDIDTQKARSSMKIGNEYRVRNIGKYQWQKLAQGCRRRVPREVVGNYVQLQSEIDENLRILGTDPTTIRLNDSRAVR
jgi:serine/threonine-protein kinase HipA